MNEQNLATKNGAIKTEPTSPGAKKVILPSSLISSSAIKKEITSRLPSFKPPRDLLLTGSTTSHPPPTLNYINSSSKASKRKYTPNVNVFRKKGTNNLQTSDISSEKDVKIKNTEPSKKSPVTNKKRSTNFIQTKGVFSEGLAPGKVKAFNSSYSERSYNESNLLEKPKLVLNQKINKNNEDAKLQSILKDDFIDDPSNLPDLNFMPHSLPTVYNAKNKYVNPKDLEKTFQNLQVKIEKVANTQNEGNKDNKYDMFHAFEENESPKLLLFEFPKMLQDEIEDKKKVTKSQSSNGTENRTKIGHLSSSGEGHWGFLRIHESGNAYFVVGSTIIPISLSRHITRQEVISTKVDQSCCRGEVIDLGTVDASFTCSTSFDNMN